MLFVTAPSHLAVTGLPVSASPAPRPHPESTVYLPRKSRSLTFRVWKEGGGGEGKLLLHQGKSFLGLIKPEGLRSQFLSV